MFASATPPRARRVRGMTSSPTSAFSPFSRAGECRSLQNRRSAMKRRRRGLMANLALRLWTAVSVTVVATLALASCSFLPEPAGLYPPLSFSARNGEPVIAWCDGDAEIVRVRMYYGAGSVGDGQLVVDGRGTETVRRGSEILPAALPKSWDVEINEYTGGQLAEVTITIVYRTTDDEGRTSTGNFIAEFDLDEATLESWPDGSWIGADGTVATDPCGMASARE